MEFWKGEALGNDYIVVDAPGGEPPSPEFIRRLCDRHRGVGGDGVLVADLAAEPVGLRIFNPDGGEAEKSGNGLRIFGAWLHALGRVGGESFGVALPAETVEMQVSDTGGAPVTVVVDMGRASFRAGDIPFADVDPDTELGPQPVEVDGRRLELHPVSMGNPHCVVLVDELDDDVFRRLAPLVQRVPAFERGVNVQFARPVSGAAVEARIWERGAGETLASGSSACAVAAVARRLGRVGEEEVEVRMPGGAVKVEVDVDWRVRLEGEARVVFRGRWLG